MFMLETFSLTADGNSAAARRARVARQPRDKYGRWIPTGARLFAGLKVPVVARDAKGRYTTVNIRGKAIGGTDKQGQIRMLADKGYEKYGIKPNTVLTVDSKNGELFSGAVLDKNFLKKKGIDPDLRHTLPKNVVDQPQTLEEMDPKPADDLDIDLAENGLSDEEDKDLRAERNDEPLAKLPPAMEVAKGEEVSDIVEAAEKGEDADAPVSLSEGDSADGAAADALGEIFYGGDAPSVEDLIDKAATPAPSAQSEDVGIADLKPGDMVILQGRPMKVESAKQRALSGGWDLMVDDGTGRGPVNVADPKRFPNGIPGNATLKKLKTGATPVATTKPAAAKKADDTAPAAPAAPAAPKPVAKPAPKAKKVTKPKSTLPTIPKGREDDGKDISRNLNSQEQMRATPIAQLFDENGKPLFARDNKGKRAPVEDPNAIYNALLEQNPQAKVDKTGHIILERGTFTDKDGKNYKYEVAVAKTHGNQYMERYSFTDEATGETQSFYHYDYKDSFAAIYGEGNGVNVFRDIMLGQRMPGKPGSKMTREKEFYFGDKSTLAKRLMYFRGKKSAGTEITDDMLDDSNFKLLTPDEIVRKYLNGRAEKLNMANAKAKGTKLQSFVGSAWEAIEADDMELFQQRMVQLLGRLPDTEESRSLLVNALRDQIKSKFNGTPQGRKLAPLANNIEKALMSDGLDLRDIQRRPWAAKDGKTILKVGDKVRYWNNVGEWSIGEVVRLRAPRKGYDDIVAVKFADGTQNVLRAKYMDVLGDDLDMDLNLHDKDSAPTNYIPSLKNDALRAARGVFLDFGDAQKQEEDSQNAAAGAPVNTTNPNAAQPYLGSDGTDADAADAADSADADAAESDADAQEEPEQPAESNISDLAAGDAWYSPDGDYLGTFVEAQVVEADDGTQAWAVIYLDEDGDEQLEIVDLGESRLPK